MFPVLVWMYARLAKNEEREAREPERRGRLGDAALLVNPRDTEEIAVAMHRLLTDDDLHAEMSEKGLQRAHTFSWEKAAWRTLEVYRQVVAARTAPVKPSASQANETGSKI